MKTTEDIIKLSRLCNQDKKFMKKQWVEVDKVKETINKLDFWEVKLQRRKIDTLDLLKELGLGD